MEQNDELDYWKDWNLNDVENDSDVIAGGELNDRFEQGIGAQIGTDYDEQNNDNFDGFAQHYVN